MITSLENVACNFCGNDNYKIVYKKDGFNIVKCNNCGLVYVNPRLTQNAITELYNDDYFVGKGFDQSVQYEKEFNENMNQIDLGDWDVSTIKNLLNVDDISKKTLLDVGSGMGLFLWKAKKQGFIPKGLELSKFAVDFSNTRGLNVENKSIFESAIKDESVDAISMKEVIEHLPDPKAALKKLYSALKPNGVLFITTGNYNCIERKLKGADWFYFMPKGHIYYFNPQKIKKYLLEAGFKKVMVTNQGDLLMNFLLKNSIIEPDKFIPAKFMKKIIFYIVRFINHFISSGMRIYAVK